MNALLVLIPVALVLGLLGLGAFLWSLRSGQFDDLDGAAVRILFDDAPPGGKINAKSIRSTKYHGDRR
jgi:cbb3-type cytochrome oxidase maturation protein